MKEVLRAAGVPTAASTAAETAQQVQDFADAVGYPLILKPRTGAGALDTTRVDDRVGLDAALASFGAQGATSIAVEMALGLIHSVLLLASCATDAAISPS